MRHFFAPAAPVNRLVNRTLASTFARTVAALGGLILLVYSAQVQAQGIRPLDDAIRFLRIGTNEASSAIYSYAVAMAAGLSAPEQDRITLRLDGCQTKDRCGVPGLYAVAQTRSGALEALADLREGLVETSLAPADTAGRALRGEIPFTGRSIPDLVVLSKIGIVYHQVLVQKDSSIRTLADLAYRRIAVGTTDSATATVTARLFRAHELPFQTLQRLEMPNEQALELLVEGGIDALIILDSAPYPPLLVHPLRARLRLISLEDPEGMVEWARLPGRDLGHITSAHYDFIDEPVRVATQDLLWVTRRDFPAEKAYLMVRAIHRGATPRVLETISGGRLFLAQPSPSDQFAIPLHAGLSAFYNQLDEDGS